MAFLACLLTRCASAPEKPVVVSMEDRQFLENFVHERCGYDWSARERQPEKRRRECQKKWALALAERLHEKYPKANLQAISAQCQDLGERCTLEEMEALAQAQQDEPSK